MPGPLHGVRIVDMTANVMGPLAAQILGDMGADIVKVEPPEGEPMRGVGAKGRDPTLSSQFLHINRNKRSVVLDLKRPEAMRVLHRLIARADVLIHTQRPQAMARLGLAYEDVAKINPRIVYAAAFGYGQSGPYAAKPAYDDLIQAAIAGPFLQAGKDGEPRYMATNLADRACGMALASAVGMALFHRERTGEGQSIEIPMFETMTQFVWGDHIFGHSFVPPVGQLGYTRMIERRPFKTRDGYLAMLLFNDRQFERFFAGIGQPEMMKRSPFLSIAMRIEKIAEVTQYLAELMTTRTTAEWLVLLDEADVPAMRVAKLEQVMDDPHLEAVGMIREVDHPRAGRVKTFGVPSTWSRSQPDIRREPPAKGEHSAEVLREEGLTDAEIDALFASGASIDGRRR